MNLEGKLVFIFNKYYFNFIDDVIQIAPSLKKQISTFCRVKNLSNSKHIHKFVNTLSGPVLDTYCKPYEAADFPDASLREVVFLKSSKANVSISIGDIFTASTAAAADDQKNTASFLYILSIIAYLYRLNHLNAAASKSPDPQESGDGDGCSDDSSTDESDVSLLVDKVLESINLIQGGKDYQASLQDIYDKTILDLLGNIAVTTDPTKNTTPAETDDVQQDDDINKTAESILGNSKIGAVAKEICDELDLSSLQNLERPEDILKMSGENNVLGDLIGKIGAKVHSKIDSGELKHEDLMSEAFNMLNMLNKGGNNPLNSPMFQNVLKNMGNMNLGAMGQLGQKARVHNTKDRLKKKLEEKHNRQL